MQKNQSASQRFSQSKQVKVEDTVMIDQEENDDGNPIKVYIRVRPPVMESEQIDNRSCIKLEANQRTLICSAHDNLHQFTFDKIFHEQTDQRTIFEQACKPTINSVIAGTNGSILVYGQTGTGKTYTMGLLQKIREENTGVVSLSLKYIFDYFSHNPQGLLNYQITLQFMQIYIDDIFDLLNPDGKKLRVIGEPQNNEVYVENLVNVPVENYSQAIQLINAGLAYRTTGPQNMNQISSRSHTILNVFITQQMSEEEVQFKDSLNFYNQTISQNNKFVISNLSFIDLAGSERLKKTMSTQIYQKKKIYSRI